ncbi:type II secretion system F family protein [Nitrosophilus labii]|uniref:type II secretion system F family protein n=1 Tax=Nitrosophilus labii TaxID=2706014 RepID=UPI001656A6F0|nr:type II secretion system F family protein [Nitrosophilus labii]
MRYRYIGFSKKGEKVSGYIEASSIEEAKRKLKDASIVYEELKEIKPLLPSFNFKKEVPKNILIDFSKTLSIYLKSGISIAKAIRLAKNQFSDGKTLDFLFQIQKNIDEGKSFYQALDKQKIYDIPKFYKESVKIAEETGTLQEVISEMADFLKNLKSMEDKTKRALIYPLFIIIVAIFMISFMLSFVIPKISAIFLQLHQELPKITKLVISIGDFLTQNWIGLVFIIFLLIFSFSFTVKKIYRFRYMLHFFILKIPIIKDIAIASNLGKFSYLMSVLTNSGVNFVHSAKLSSETLQNEVIKRIFQDASKELVEGKRFSNALVKNGFNFDKSFIQSIALAEETSEVTEIFKNLSELFKEKNSAKIELFLSLLEPTLLLVVGIIIGFIVTAMLLPIFSMNLTVG